MRALTSILVLALAAPMPALACGMMMREDTVNLAEALEVLDETPDAPEVEPVAVAEVAPEAEVEAPPPSENEATPAPSEPQS